MMCEHENDFDVSTEKYEKKDFLKKVKPLLAIAILICTPFVGHPTKGVLSCAIVMNLNWSVLNCINKESIQILQKE